MVKGQQTVMCVYVSRALSLRTAYYCVIFLLVLI